MFKPPLIYVDILRQLERYGVSTTRQLLKRCPVTRQPSRIRLACEALHGYGFIKPESDETNAGVYWSITDAGKNTLANW